MRKELSQVFKWRIINILLASLSQAFLFLLMLLSVQCIFGQGNNLIEISGKVIDQDNKQPLQSVSVQIKGTIAGTTTNSKGLFSIRTKNKFPLTLIFSSVGFQPQE